MEQGLHFDEQTGGSHDGADGAERQETLDVTLPLTCKQPL